MSNAIVLANGEVKLRPGLGRVCELDMLEKEC